MDSARHVIEDHYIQETRVRNVLMAWRTLSIMMLATSQDLILLEKRGFKMCLMP